MLAYINHTNSSYRRERISLSHVTQHRKWRVIKFPHTHTYTLTSLALITQIFREQGEQNRPIYVKHAVTDQKNVGEEIQILR